MLLRECTEGFKGTGAIRAFLGADLRLQRPRPHIETCADGHQGNLVFILRQQADGQLQHFDLLFELFLLVALVLQACR